MVTFLGVLDDEVVNIMVVRVNVVTLVVMVTCLLYPFCMVMEILP